MKIKLPNGIEIEADQVNVRPDGTIEVLEIKTEENRKTSPSFVTHQAPIRSTPALAALSRKRRQAYDTLAALGDSHVSAIAKNLNITTMAAGQRMSVLIEMNLVERYKTGYYRVR